MITVKFTLRILLQTLATFGQKLVSTGQSASAFDASTI